MSCISLCWDWSADTFATMTDDRTYADRTVGTRAHVLVLVRVAVLERVLVLVLRQEVLMSFNSISTQLRSGLLHEACSHGASGAPLTRGCACGLSATRFKDPQQTNYPLVLPLAMPVHHIH